MRTRISQVRVSVAVLLLCAATTRTQQERRYKELPNFYKVDHELYRGAQPKIGGLELLKQMGITTVINLRNDDDNARQEEAAALKIGLKYFNLPLDSWGRPQTKEIQQLLSIIADPVNQPVFVHCRQGADRTGVLIAVYRLTHDGWSSHQAIEEAKRFGLKPWQLGMKDFIHDYYQHQIVHQPPATNDQ